MTNFTTVSVRTWSKIHYKEGSRSILLKAGFPHALWPRAVEYSCIVHSFSNLAALHQNESDEVTLEKSLLTCYEAANNGDPFAGWRIPFGAMVYYKPPKKSGTSFVQCKKASGHFRRLES